MATLLASHSIVGNEKTDIVFPNDEKAEVLSINWNELSIPKEQEVKFKRSLSKDGFIALACYQKSLQQLNSPLNMQKVGLYTSFLNGPFLEDLIAETEKKTFPEAFNNLRMKSPPKQVFRQNSAVKATHMAMLLQSNGPQMTFVSPTTGLIDALNAAEIDLLLGTVDFAIVVSAFSFEETQIPLFYKDKFHLDTIRESGVCLILSKGSQLNQHQCEASTDYSYGLCSPYFAKKLIFES